MNTRVLYLTGLSGSGKSTVCRELKAHGIQSFYSAEIAPRLIEGPLPNDPLAYGTAFGEEEGFIAAIMRGILEGPALGSVIAVDSLRSPSEWSYVQQLPFEARLVAVVCDKETRMHRLRRRDGSKWMKVHERDAIELGLRFERRFEIGRLIGIADHYIDTTPGEDEMKWQVARLLRSVVPVSNDCNTGMVRDKLSILRQVGNEEPLEVR